MNQKYLVYGLGAAALFMFLKGKKQEPEPVVQEITPPAKGKKKKPVPKVVVAEITDIQFGAEVEKVIARIMAIQRPEPGVAPAIQVSVPGEASELDTLYAALTKKLQGTLTPRQQHDMFVTLSKKDPRTRRQETLWEALGDLN